MFVFCDDDFLDLTILRNGKENGERKREGKGKMEGWREEKL